jgi:2-polyprenyl-6-methoxyphenol hydroxylase-like FAD-dependent oxidoreductase
VIRWHQYGGYRQQFSSGLRGIVVSRALLEWKIRRRIMALPNVDIRDGMRVERLIPNSNLSRITGIQVRDSQDNNSKRGLVADFFIDASGRGTRTPRWLVEIGYLPPTKEEVRVDLGYVSRIYRRRQSDRRILEIGGWHGQPLPQDDRSLIGFLRDVPAPDIFHVLKDAQPLTDIVVHKFPASRRLRYEQLARFPDGYLVIGDALASFNPVYGQGMTSIAMQAAALDALLKGVNNLSGLWRPYYKEMARVVDPIWQLSVSEDFRFPKTRGKKPFATDLFNWYIGRVHKATHRDTNVYAQFLQVMNLLASPSSLLHPRILLRVMKDILRRRGRAAVVNQRHVKSIYASAKT